MWTVFLVNVEYVDAETVALLKGAVAQVAGELPVTQVNAARVFKMAIAVVFVRENFSATMAGVT